MPNETDFLKDYVQVKDRVAALFELYGQARIETTYEITKEPDDRPKVICRAVVYRMPEDTYPAGTGTSWLYLPGTTNFTKGSEIENAETSAVGRAIGFLGILTEKGMATANEIAGKRDDSPRPVASGPLTGKAVVGEAPGDYALRESPDEGWSLSFKLMDGRKGFKVVAEDDLAQALALVQGDVVGDFLVSCWGRMGTESFMKDGRKITYNVLFLDRITTPTVTLPAETDELDALPVLS